MGGFRNPVTDAHNLSAELSEHDEVSNAVPMSFQMIYVGTEPDGSDLQTVIGSGVPGTGSAVSMEEGDGFSGGDEHYAGGSYDGPMSHEVIIDPELAEELDVEVGDTVHLGGTTTAARNNEYEVVGISSTMSGFLGTSTATIRLSELQTLTATEYEDRATLLSVTLEEGADAEAVRDDLQTAHPNYTFRTNQEQFVQVLQRQAVVLAGGLSLVLLGVLAGAALSLNLLLSLIYVQRDSFAVIRAVGMSRLSVVGVAVTQALTVALVGCLVGVAMTPIVGAAIEAVALEITGFEGLVRVPVEAYIGGAAVAFGFSLVGAVGGTWRVIRVASTDRLIS